jgi:predicted Zn-dependent protease
MAGYDGVEIPGKHPTVALVFFEERDHELKNALLESLEECFAWLDGEIPSRPKFSICELPNPKNIPSQNQDAFFFPFLDQANGNIILGVTGVGFYDPSLPRFIFSYGRWNGRALLSTYRFRTETTSRSLLLERLRKQIIKTLAMACGLGPCSNPECVVSYHRLVEDLDRNRYVCNTCRTELIQSLSIFLKQDEDSNDFQVGTLI